MPNGLFRYCKAVAQSRAARLLAAMIVIATLLTGLSVKTVEQKKVGRFVICSDELIIDIVDDVCASYRSGEVTGALCKPLCEERTMTYIRCFGDIMSKMAALYQTPNNTQFVLKTELTVYGHLTKYISHNEGLDADAFMAKIRSTLRATFGVTSELSNARLFTKLLSGTNTYENKTKLPDDVMNSLWNLIKQKEYAFYVLFSDQSFMPRVYSSCGPLYATEFAPVMTNLQLLPWHKKAEVALEIIEVLNTLDTAFVEPIYLCDFKRGNLGKYSDRPIKIIDGDWLFLKSQKAKKNSHKACTSDRDCSSVECKGRCNTRRKRCAATVYFNKFQAMCHALTISGRHLLADSPTKLNVRSRLNRLLEECTSYGDTYPTIYPDPVNKLTDLLKESIQQR